LKGFTEKEIHRVKYSVYTNERSLIENIRQLEQSIYIYSRLCTGISSFPGIAIVK